MRLGTDVGLKQQSYRLSARLDAPRLERWEERVMPWWSAGIRGGEHAAGGAAAGDHVVELAGYDHGTISPSG